MTSKNTYDLKISKVVEAFKPKWFDDIPWHLSASRKLHDNDLFSLDFMDMIEGHVCAGYVHLALAPYEIRRKTERTDFVIGWGAQQNWHGISLHRFLDQYQGRMVSTRIEMQDDKRSRISFAQKHSSLIAGIAATAAPITYTAMYACLGYRNELMTMHGYGSLLTKINKSGGSPHPVLDPLLKNIMSEEARHASYYKDLAATILNENPGVRKVIRKAFDFWFGIVGENFAGRSNADRVIRHLFEDAYENKLAEKIDKVLGLLPGMRGITPMQKRVADAFSHA